MNFTRTSCDKIIYSFLIDYFSIGVTIKSSILKKIQTGRQHSELACTWLTVKQVLKQSVIVPMVMEHHRTTVSNLTGRELKWRQMVYMTRQVAISGGEVI